MSQSRRLAAILAADVVGYSRLQSANGARRGGDGAGFARASRCGDGVNIAAQIEAVADAGGVFVSNRVHDHVRPATLCLDLGEQ